MTVGQSSAESQAPSKFDILQLANFIQRAYWFSDVSMEDHAISLWTLAEHPYCRHDVLRGWRQELFTL